MLTKINMCSIIYNMCLSHLYDLVSIITSGVMYYVLCIPILLDRRREQIRK